MPTPGTCRVDWQTPAGGSGPTVLVRQNLKATVERIRIGIYLHVEFEDRVPKHLMHHNL